jgi:hypothetical protein
MGNLDEKIDESLNNMKSQIKNEKLSDDFKNNLIKEMNEYDEIQKTKKHHIPGWITAVACCTIVFTGYCIAGEFENVILKHLSNIDEIAKKAVEEGNVEYLDTDYVTDNGISIKADYLIHQDGNTYIALSFKDGEYDKIKMIEYEILDENGAVIYNNIYGDKYINKCICFSSDKGQIYIKLFEKNYKNESTILIKEINLFKNNDVISLKGNWRIKLK